MFIIFFVTNPSYMVIYSFAFICYFRVLDAAFSAGQKVVTVPSLALSCSVPSFVSQVIVLCKNDDEPLNIDKGVIKLLTSHTFPPG